MWLPIVITVLTGYLLGNLNGAISVSNMLKDDVRNHGSGNAGLTNFIRNYGRSSAIFVILIDVLKSVLACFVGALCLDGYGYAQEGAVIGAIAVTLGHDFPVLLGMKGGKGILCGVSVAAVVDYRCALLIFGIFLVVMLLSRYVSLGSIAGAVSMAVYFGVNYLHKPVVMAGGIFLGVLAVFMHRSNILRLCKGNENKISFGKKGSPE